MDTDHSALALVQETKRSARPPHFAPSFTEAVPRVYFRNSTHAVSKFYSSKFSFRLLSLSRIVTYCRVLEPEAVRDDPSEPGYYPLVRHSK